MCNSSAKTCRADEFVTRTAVCCDDFLPAFMHMAVRSGVVLCHNGVALTLTALPGHARPRSLWYFVYEKVESR